MKKAWDVKKIKEENVGDDFLDQCMAGVQGRAPNARTWCTLDVYYSTRRGCAQWRTESLGRMCHNAQWRAEAHCSMCHSAPAARSLVGTVAPAEQVPCGAQWHTRTSARARTERAARRVL